MALTASLLRDLATIAIDEDLDKKKATKRGTSEIVDEATVKYHVDKVKEIVLTAAELGDWSTEYSMENCTLELTQAVATGFKYATKGLMVIIQEGTPKIIVDWKKSQEV